MSAEPAALAAGLPDPSAPDERLRRPGAIKALARHPSAGAAIGLVVVVALFMSIANPAMFGPRGVMNWLEVGAQLAVLAVGACLLMIAGEFDLSMGSMIGFAGMAMALLIAFAHVPPWLAILIGFAIALGTGFLIGFLRVRTGLPSFIVSLAFLFILRGATIVTARALNGTTLIGGLRDLKASDPLAYLFGGEVGGPALAWLAKAGYLATLPNGRPVVSGVPMVVLWAVLFAALGAYVLNATRFGNWILATGGDPNAARSAGIPIDRVRITLFMFTAFCSAVFAACQVFEFGSADASRGLLKEFEAIIAAVIGGGLLSGGYGSVIGAAMGALIFGIVSQGFFFTGIDGDWFQIFLGVVLLGAVIFNTYARKRVTGGI